MTHSPVLTAPEFGLLVLVAVCIIATRVVWTRVKGERRHD